MSLMQDLVLAIFLMTLGSGFLVVLFKFLFKKVGDL